MSITSSIESTKRAESGADETASGTFARALASGKRWIDGLIEHSSRGGRDPVRPLKWTFAAILSVVIIGAITSNLLREREAMRSGLARIDHAVIEFLAEYQRVQIAGLEKTLVSLTGNKSILFAFEARNRKALQRAAAPIFEQLRDRHEVTHFSFIDPRRVNFLRLHEPEHFGDGINRYTTLAAASSHEVVGGLEFGQYGGFTLRVVKPWIFENELIGFVELGIEIGHFLDAIERSLDVMLIETYDKNAVEYDHWVALEHLHARETYWNMSTRYALSASDISAVPGEIVDHIRADLEATGDDLTALDGRTRLFATLDGAYHMLPIRQIDVAGREVGRLIIVRDITNDILAFLVSQAAILAIALALWFAALGIFNRVAAQVQGIVTENQDRLDYEVASRTSALEASENRYREAQRVSNFGNWERNIVTGEIFWSDEVYRIHGVEPGSFTPTRKALFDFVHPDDREGLLATVTKAIDANTGYSIEHRIVRADGEVRFVHKKGATEYAGDGTPLRTMGVVHDVTDRRRAEQALRESEQMFSTAFFHSPMMLAMTDPQSGVFQDANDTWLNTLGYAKEEIVGQSSIALDIWVNPDDRECLLRMVEEIGTVQGFETKFRTKSGEVIDVLFFGTLVRSAGRQLFFGCCSDVTEKNRAAEALRERDGLVSQALQLSTTLVALSYMDDGRFFEVNDAWVHTLGYSRDELIDNTALNLGIWVNPEHRAEVMNQLQLWGSVRAYEAQLRAKNGDIIDILFSGSLLKLGGRTVLFGISSDVTKLRQAEDLSRRLARVMEESLNEIYIFDSETFRFIHINQAAQENLGFTLEEITELTPWHVKPEFDEARFIEMVDVLRQGDMEAMRFETIHRRKDGTTYDVDVQLQLFREEDPPVFVAIINDVTERKQAERAIANLNQDLEHRVEERTEELRVAHDQLLESEKMASLGGLVAGVAHEINTPIGIGVTAASHLHGQSSGLRDKLNAGTLKKSELDTYFDSCDEWTSILLSNLNRASDLVRSFKNVSVDQLIEDRREINFISYVNDIVRSLRPKLKQTAIEVEITGDSELMLDTYPGAISQIVTNLTINSLIHAFDEGDAGKIRISATGDEDGIVMVFSDTGRGIAPEHLPRLFEPFFTTRRGQGGSGLGLNVVYNLVTQKLDGKITCTSQPGEGATFTISLPVLK